MSSKEAYILQERKDMARYLPAGKIHSSNSSLADLLKNKCLAASLCKIPPCLPFTRKIQSPYYDGGGCIIRHKSCVTSAHATLCPRYQTPILWHHLLQASLTLAVLSAWNPLPPGLPVAGSPLWFESRHLRHPSQSCLPIMLFYSIFYIVLSLLDFICSFFCLQEWKLHKTRDLTGCWQI